MHVNNQCSGIYKYVCHRFEATDSCEVIRSNFDIDITRGAFTKDQDLLCGYIQRLNSIILIRLASIIVIIGCNSISIFKKYLKFLKYGIDLKALLACRIYSFILMDVFTHHSILI